MSQPQSPATDIPGRGIFVGGEAQIERLHHLLVESTPRVLFLHGLAGAGKTTLINQFALGERQQSDAAVLKVDGREIEPTQTGFLAAVLEALDFTTDEPASLEQTMASLQTIAEKVVLSVDHYELLRLLDTWLRLEFVPRLPASVSLLLAGREQPNPAWSRLPAGTFESMTLEPLGPEDSARLLRELGVDDQHVATIARFASGHPLTLVLAALTAKERPAEPVRDITMAKLFDQFTAAYLGALDAETTKILEAAAVVRRLTISLVVAMLPDHDAREVFDRLGRLPFVEVTRDGLALHATIQDSIATRLWAESPNRHREYRRRAWRHLRDQLRTVPESGLWRHTADMIYLLENRSVREAHFPTNAHTFAIEPARSSDAASVTRLIARHEPPAAAELLARWWSESRESFRVARDLKGQVVGFSVLTTTTRQDLGTFAEDPVTELWLDHLEKSPLASGEEALFLRRWLTWEQGDGPCDAQAALWLDLKRMYMELRPRLRRIYSATDHPEIFGPALTQLDAEELARVTMGDREYTGFCLDFGPSSVDGWLTRVAARELGIEDDTVFDVRQRRLVVDGSRVDLTPKEFEVMAFLSERVGEAVARTELLQSIWGYEEVLGSNVVDTVVHGLRKKLGTNSELLETVRGVGYRLAAR